MYNVLFELKVHKNSGVFDVVKFKEEDDELKNVTLVEGVWALRVLILVLRFGVNGIDNFLQTSSNTIDIIIDKLLHIDQFSLYCLEIIHIVSEHTKGVALLTQDDKYTNALLQIYESAAVDIAGPLGSNTDYSNINASATSSAVASGGKEKGGKG